MACNVANSQLRLIKHRRRRRSELVMHAHKRKACTHTERKTETEERGCRAEIIAEGSGEERTDLLG
jgi:hypothetical protein